jgi:hypothetical protein
VGVGVLAGHIVLKILIGSPEQTQTPFQLPSGFFTKSSATERFSPAFEQEWKMPASPVQILTRRQNLTWRASASLWWAITTVTDKMKKSEHQNRKIVKSPVTVKPIIATYITTITIAF